MGFSLAKSVAAKSVVSPISGTFDECWYGDASKLWRGEARINLETGRFVGVINDVYGRSMIAGKILKNGTAMEFQKKYVDRNNKIYYCFVKQDEGEWFGMWCHNIPFVENQPEDIVEEKIREFIETAKANPEIGLGDAATCEFVIPDE